MALGWDDTRFRKIGNSDFLFLHAVVEEVFNVKSGESLYSTIRDFATDFISQFGKI